MLCGMLAILRRQKKGTGGRGKRQYLEGKVSAVAQMDSLQAAVARGIVFAGNDVAVRIPTRTQSLVRLCQSVDTLVSDIGTLDQPDSLQLGEGRQAGDRVVGQVDAASEIDVADPVTALDEALDGVVRDVAAVAEVDVMQVLAQPGDGKYGGIGDVAALGQDHVP